MRRFFKSAYSITLALALITTSTPMMVSANVVTSGTNKLSTDFSKTMTTQEDKQDDKKDDTANYRQGEAVVMYYADTTLSKAKIQSIFGNGISVDETWNFSEDSSSKSSTRSGIVTNQSLLVSKVSSKTLSTEQLVSKLNKKSEIKYAEPNYILTSRELSGTFGENQWSLENNGQNSGIKDCDINPESIWKETTGTEKVIAIIDTGVDYTHTDLKSNIWNNPYTKTLKGAHGYDFANKDDDPMDDNGHGSHCAGIIAGNDTGISGVNKSAKIMALKFLDSSGSGDVAGAIGAYDYIYKAMKLGVDVVSINNSWGGGESSQILEYLVNLVGEKGAISVVAAGNSSSNNDEVGNTPFNFKSDYLITVAASNESDELAGFSSYGNKTVDLAAPGADILSSVSYDCYNPTIHNNDSNYSEYYNDFNETVDLSNISKFSTTDKESVSVLKKEGVSFGTEGKDGNSICLSIDAKQSGYYGFYIPLDLPESSTNYYVSAMVKGIAHPQNPNDEISCFGTMGVKEKSFCDNSSIDQLVNGNTIEFGLDSSTNYWSMLSSDSQIKSSKDGKYAVFFCAWIDTVGKYDIYIDNIGLSKKDSKPSDFGKYDFYNGTSMATPQVTGAVALLSEVYSTMDRSDLRDLVANSVRKGDSFKDTTISGGVLDLSKAVNASPIIKSIETSKDSITLTGNFFSDTAGTVTINGNNVKTTSWNNKQITIPSNGYLNKYIQIKVTRKDGKTTEQKHYTSYNSTQINDLGKVIEADKGHVTTDGTSLYYLNNNGLFQKYSNGEWSILPELSVQLLDPDSIDQVNISLGVTPEVYTQLVYENGAFYGLASYDTGYYVTKKLVKYSIKDSKWSSVCELSGDLADLEQCTLAAYNGKLYILGGISSSSQEIVGTVYTYDCVKKGAKIEKSKQTIPTRFASLAAVADGKLVLTLGGNGTKKCPENIVFDGKKWTTVANTGIKTPFSSSYYVADDKEYTYYTAQIGLYENGIIYTGLVSNDYGDVFTFNVKTGKYTGLPCSLYEYMKDATDCFGTTVGNKFMFISATVTSIFDEDTFEDIILSDAKLYSFDVKTGMYKVTSNISKQISGLGYYYPGSKATITLKPAKGYYASTFTVNGTKVKGNTYAIPSINRNYQVKVAWGKYVQSIKFSAKNVSVKAKKSLQLKVQVSPSSATNKGLTWSVSNTAYATVNQKGVVTAKKAGIGKKVTVTAKAKDGSKVVGKVVVNIKK